MNKGKNKRRQTTSELLKFLKKNWASVVSIAISLMAVLISIQSNVYSRKASNSGLLIEDIGELHRKADDQVLYVVVHGCNDDYSDGYLLHFSTIGEFWVSNTGGLDTTLLVVDFSSDIGIDDSNIDPNKKITWITLMREHSSLDVVGNEINSLEIPAGKGVPLYVVSDYDLSFPTIEDATHFFQSIIFDGVTQKTIDKDGIWFFRFSNGNTYNKIYHKVNIRLENSIENYPKTIQEQLGVSCAIMNRNP